MGKLFTQTKLFVYNRSVYELDLIMKLRYDTVLKTEYKHFKIQICSSFKDLIRSDMDDHLKPPLQTVFYRLIQIWSYWLCTSYTSNSIIYESLYKHDLKYKKDAGLHKFVN